MTDRPDTLPRACAAAREAIQHRLDGPLDAERSATLGEHLTRCADCRDYQRDLRCVQDALSSLPELRLPDETLEQVWSRTVRDEQTFSRTPALPRRGFRLVYAAAAVAVLGVVLIFWGSRNAPHTTSGSADAGYTEQQIEQARAELGRVLSLTSGAIDRGTWSAYRVLAGKVSPALRRIPVRLPGSSADRKGDERRSQT